MPYVFRMSESSNKCAIYSVSSLASVPTGPLTTPNSNVSVLAFHSDWFYPNIVGNNQTGSGTIPSAGDNTFPNGVVTLFAHGQSGTPLVLGTVTIGGTVYSLTGSTPIDRGNGNHNWLNFETDATYVYLRYYGASKYNTGGTPATNFTYDVKVTNCLSSGAVPGVVAGEPLFKWYPSGNYLTIGRGKIDTRRRYLKRSGSGQSVKVIRGATIEMRVRVNNNNQIQFGPFAAIAYRLEGYNLLWGGAITIDAAVTEAYA